MFYEVVTLYYPPHLPSFCLFSGEDKKLNSRSNKERINQAHFNFFCIFFTLLRHFENQNYSDIVEDADFLHLLL